MTKHQLIEGVLEATMKIDSFSKDLCQELSEKYIRLACDEKFPLDERTEFSLIGSGLALLYATLCERTALSN